MVSAWLVSRRVISWCCRSRSCACKLGATTGDGSWRRKEKKREENWPHRPCEHSPTEILDSCCEMNHTDIARLSNSILTADAFLAADCVLARLCDNVAAICPFTMQGDPACFDMGLWLDVKNYHCPLWHLRSFFSLFSFSTFFPYAFHKKDAVAGNRRTE